LSTKKDIILARKRHTNKEVESAIRYAEQKEWAEAKKLRRVVDNCIHHVKEIDK